MSTQQTGSRATGPDVDEQIVTRRRAATSHARDFGPGFFVKLVLVAVLNALGVYGMLAAAAVGSWGIVGFLVIALVLVDWVYFSRRMLPMKYLLPGLLFLLVYQLYVMGYTGYVAFTNYGDGHNSTKADAIAAIQIQTERRVEGSPSYPLAVLEKGGVLALAIVENDKAMVGTADQALAPVDGATVEAGRVTAVPGYTTLAFAQIAQRQDEITNLRVPVTADGSKGSLRTQDAS
ncbi:MAG TPA: maltose ABC transporter permease, partial [Cellulomonas sp.]|nr:maltose ABC transporter permease [Cellulomonas sp.]